MHTKENTPIAQDESAVADLIDALAVGDGSDLVRELARSALQELIELEASPPTPDKCSIAGRESRSRVDRQMVPSLILPPSRVK